jgi:N-methylhydantoinase A/oxoprolinase/acetone carboxylase beta subunit
VADIFSLGLDTGGTYTDAVLYSDEAGVVAKAKALTTHHDLTIGIREAADNILDRFGRKPIDLGLVCLSTTLATNALVEGRGGRVALVTVGFGEAELGRDGLKDAVGDGPVIALRGGHDVHGRETTLELAPLADALHDLPESVDAVAVAGYFAVRNPAHELAVRDLVRQRTGLPVTCSHELSSRLGGPRRALTTVLNARLIGMIDRLIGATETYLAGRGARAPLMIVRGDGALVAAAEARLRPIETILSGPAASLVGARHLTGLERAIVSDIGGTTTDIAVLDEGRPRLDREGAVVGGYRTMVEAVAMRTFGLGGDSEVHLEHAGLTCEFRLGPRRCVPLSLAAQLHGEAVLEPLARQARAELPGRLDGLFAFLADMRPAGALGLDSREKDLLGRLSEHPQPLDAILQALPERVVLDRLVRRGAAAISAFTPSDAMHVLGRQNQWNTEAARLGAAILARKKDGAGKQIAGSPDALARIVADRLALQSAHCLLETALAEDDAAGVAAGATAIDPRNSPSIRRALGRDDGIVRFRIALDRPLVGLGASAAIHYPAIAEMIGADGIVPDHADVANAVGAVVGQVRVRVEAFVTMPNEESFAVTGLAATARFHSERDALDYARNAVSAEAERRALKAGALGPAVSVSEEVVAPQSDGRRSFVEARVTAVATGRPRLVEA